MENPNQPAFLMIIPDDVIAKICVRLPAKCIGRFRTISKSWNSLLSEPQFIRNHNDRIRNFPTEDEQLSFLLESYESGTLFRAHSKVEEMTASAIELNIIGIDPHFEREIVFTSYLATCHGLVLVGEVNGKLLVINPTIKQIKVLPDLPYYDFNPTFISTMFGLGFDSVNDDYKVVVILYDLTKHGKNPITAEMGVSVYSFRRGTWERAQNSAYDHGTVYPMSGIFLNGRIHWVACRKTEDVSSVLLAFDLSQEIFHVVPLPLIDPEEFLDCSLVALGGCLSIDLSRLGPAYDVWVMREYDVEESWTRLTVIDPDKWGFKLLCSAGKEQVVVVKYKGYQRLGVYNWEDTSFKDIVVQGISGGYHVCENYLESLVSPHYYHS